MMHRFIRRTESLLSSSSSETRAPSMVISDLWLQSSNGHSLSTFANADQGLLQAPIDSPPVFPSLEEASLIPNSTDYQRHSTNQYPFKSGTSKSSINNPKLLATIQEAIRRLILPELDELKEEQKIQTQRGRLKRATNPSNLPTSSVSREGFEDSSIIEDHKPYRERIKERHVPDVAAGALLRAPVLFMPNPSPHKLPPGPLSPRKVGSKAPAISTESWKPAEGRVKQFDICDSREENVLTEDAHFERLAPGPKWPYSSRLSLRRASITSIKTRADGDSDRDSKINLPSQSDGEGPWYNTIKRQPTLNKRSYLARWDEYLMRHETSHGETL